MSVRSFVRASLGTAIVALLAYPAPALAQRRPTPPPKPAARPHRPAPHPGSIEVSGGFLWDAGFDLGTAAADETRNPTTGTGPYQLFTTSSRLHPAYGAAARVGYFVTSTLEIEGALHYLKPKLSTDVSGDVEGAQNVTATESFSRYIFDASVLWHLRNLSFAGRNGVPFVVGGASYIRELHDGNELLETGNEIHAGAGIKFFLNQGRRRYRLRGEAGIASRGGAFDFSEGRRTLVRAGASLFVVF